MENRFDFESKGRAPFMPKVDPGLRDPYVLPFVVEFLGKKKRRRKKEETICPVAKLIPFKTNKGKSQTRYVDKFRRQISMEGSRIVGVFPPKMVSIHMVGCQEYGHIKHLNPFFAQKKHTCPFMDPEYGSCFAQKGAPHFDSPPYSTTLGMVAPPCKN